MTNIQVNKKANNADLHICIACHLVDDEAKFFS